VVAVPLTLTPSWQLCAIAGIVTVTGAWSHQPGGCVG
jgi:hypothetical protein